MTKKEALWSKHNAALRHPSEIFGSPYEFAGITSNSLEYSADESFAKLLFDNKIMLIASREYENLLIALRASDRKHIQQSFFHLPHPSGIAVNRTANSVYVAATRNPNQIVEFKLSAESLYRKKISKQPKGFLLPARAKYYPGEYYFHDLAMAGGKLYANSVGMNCIIQVDFNKQSPEKPVWWPKCIETDKGVDTSINYIQLNSIAAGKTLRDSYFSASGAQIASRRPGHRNYPVDGTGVIFSGKTREPFGGGLTRPHSARLHNGKIWVANSGYGQVGYIEEGVFKPIYTFNGWTRGLCFVKDILFVGVSRVLPRFRQYAPGIKSKQQDCAIVAIDLAMQRIVGSVKFPYGNQLFAIDFIDSGECAGFPFKTVRATDTEKKIFSVSLV